MEHFRAPEKLTDRDRNLLSHQNKSAEAKAMATELEEHARQRLGQNNSVTEKYAQLLQSVERKP